MARERWTSPYYGVQHLTDAPEGCQVTVEDHGTFAGVFMLALHGGSHPFTPIRESDHGTAEEARKAGEAFARSVAR